MEPTTAQLALSAAGLVGGLVIAGIVIRLGIRAAREVWKAVRRDVEREAASRFGCALASEIQKRHMSVAARVDEACDAKNGMFRKADAIRVCDQMLEGILLSTTELYAKIK